MELKKGSLIAWVVVIILACCQEGRPLKYDFNPSATADNIVYAGVRSSNYGIKPFPEPEGWQAAMTAMAADFPGATPCGIWIVGRLQRPKSCLLEFPADGGRHELIAFMAEDKHEPYLDHFDRVGIKVFLQVEPANADVGTLIDLVLDRYKHHPSVIGFGIDVEWHREFDNPEWGVKVTDAQAEAWEKRVRSHNEDYGLFLKHWDRDWMPPAYRGDIIFVDDSQIFEDFGAMLEEFIDYWAAYFYPNSVFFQIGYPSDRKWWSRLETPPRSMGRTIASHIEQDCGIFWVDFTLRDVLPTTGK